MDPWQLLDSTKVPGEKDELRLYRRAGEFSIRIGVSELMNSRVHGSEEAMAHLACAGIAAIACPRILIGGLGMGYTLAAALQRLGPASRVVVAELAPAVVAWNRGPLGPLAGHPLADKRVTVRETDVAQVIREEPRSYDAILLDVDNGPRGLTRKENDGLYSRTGLSAIGAALRPEGVFALWSVSPDRAFVRLLNRAGFAVDEETVRARGHRGGGCHRIWIARRDGRPRGVPAKAKAPKKR